MPKRLVWKAAAERSAIKDRFVVRVSFRKGPPMDSEEAQHEHLIEIAASALQHQIAIDFARVVRALYWVHQPTREETAESASAYAAVVAANKALADWRSPEARLARGIDALP